VTNHERVTEEGEASRRHNMSSAERAILPHGFVMQKNMAKGKFAKGGIKPHLPSDSCLTTY
jgi:hypothetical protein